MSDTPTKRGLTPAESRAVSLCKVFEKACDNKKLTITLTAGKEAAEIIQKLHSEMGICRVMKVAYNPKQSNYEVTFTTIEFRKYLEFVLERVGLTLMIDGSLKTFDKLTISNEYLQ